MGTGTAPARNRVFSVPLEALVHRGEKIPSVVDRLITSIELYGLYTEGLYRKSGAQTKVSHVFVDIILYMQRTMIIIPVWFNLLFVDVQGNTLTLAPLQSLFS